MPEAIGEWFDYAAQRVPELQQAITGRARQLKHGDELEDNEKNRTNVTETEAQRPRVFYRRQSELEPLVITKLAAKTGEQREEAPESH